MNYWVLLGIAVVIIGFTLKLDSLLIILSAAIVTSVAGGINLIELLELFGSNFVGSRYMNVFLLTLLLTGTLERNGLRLGAADFIQKRDIKSPHNVMNVYSIISSILGAFNVGLGGVAGFVRPVILPMCRATIEKDGVKMNPEHLEDVKGMCGGLSNITWFFFQVVFIGGSGGLLVKGAMESIGYEVDLAQLAFTEIPVALFAVAFMMWYYSRIDQKHMRTHYQHLHTAKTEH